MTSSPDQPEPRDEQPQVSLSKPDEGTVPLSKPNVPPADETAEVQAQPAASPWSASAGESPAENPQDSAPSSGPGYAAPPGAQQNPVAQQNPGAEQNPGYAAPPGAQPGQPGYAQPQPGPGYAQPQPGYGQAPGYGPGPQQAGYAQPGGYQQAGYGQPGGFQQQPGGYPGAAVNPSDERLWATLAHVGPLVLGLISGGWLGWLATLIIYLMYKDRSPFIREHAAQALNFQIIVWIGVVVSYLLMFVVIGFFTIFVIAILAIIFPIMAAVAANRGENYTYPMTPRMIS